MSPQTPPAPASSTSDEIRKVYAADLKDKEAVHTVFKVTRKVRHAARSGKVFLALGFGDRSGEVEGRIFENVDAAAALFEEGDYVLVKGNVLTYQGKLQVVVDRVEKLDPGPIDAAEFAVPPPKPVAAPEPRQAETGAKAVGQIRELVLRVSDANVKALLLAFLDDPEIGELLQKAPAAKGIHHAYRGGLADHILSVMRLAHRMADHYPMVDRDLLIAGALLHDIMKVREITAERGGFEYTDEGRLVGHLVMTAQSIREKALQLKDFPPLLEQHITHIVLAHHGRLEWGSPKLPMTLEALLVHEIDSIDSRVASWLDLMGRDGNEKWTENSKLYERHLWKAAPPTARGRAPVETRPGAKKSKNKGSSGQGSQNPPSGAQQHASSSQGQGQGQGPQRSAKERGPGAGHGPTAGNSGTPGNGGSARSDAPREDRPRRDRPERGPKPTAGGKPSPKDLTFKPFAELASISTPGTDSNDEAAPTPRPDSNPGEKPSAQE